MTSICLAVPAPLQFEEERSFETVDEIVLRESKVNAHWLLRNSF